MFIVVRRIIQLYDRMTHKFRYRLDLFKQYLVFCYKIHSKKQISKVLTQALSTHPNNLQFWLIGIYYEFEIERNPFKARKIFFKALKINGANIEFWREYFAFEARFFQLVSERAKLIRKSQENEEFKKESDKNDDFLGFDGFGRKFIEKSGDLIENKGNVEGSQEAAFLEVLRTVYESSKEKFDRKIIILDCYKTLKGLMLWEEIGEKLGISQDLEEERMKDGVFAYEVYKEKSHDLEEIIEKIKEFKEIIRFLKSFVRKNEDSEVIGKIWGVLKKSGVLEKLLNEDRQNFNEIGLGFLKQMKNMKNLEEKAMISGDLKEIIQEFIEKDGEMLEIYLEILLLNEEKFEKSDYEFLMKTFKAKKSQFSKEMKMKVLNCLLVFNNKSNEKMKNQQNLEIFSLALENLLLFSEELGLFLDNFLKNIPNENKENYYQILFKYKSSLPLEIWLKYMEFLPEKAYYNKKKNMIQQLKVWFPKKIVKILEFEQKLEEEVGNYVEIQRIAYEISKNS